MNKKIEDYLCYHIGQEVEFEFTTITGRKENRVGTLISFTMPGFVEIELHGYHKRTSSSVKLRLRSLSDMTKEEREIFGWQEDWIFEDKSDPNQPLKTTFLVWEFIDLLKMGFDLFGLIPTGLAVDKTKEVTNATN